MPIGPPFQVPEPKSAFSPVVRPMLFRYAAERGWTGRESTRAFHTLSAGNVGQPAIDAGAFVGAALLVPRSPGTVPSVARSVASINSPPTCRTRCRPIHYLLPRAPGAACGPPWPTAYVRQDR